MATDQDLRLRAEKQALEKVEAHPESQPTAKYSSQNSWTEMVRAADTPMPAYRAPTSHSADKGQRYILPPHGLEQAAPDHCRLRQSSPFPVHSRAAASVRRSEQPHQPA